MNKIYLMALAIFSISATASDNDIQKNTELAIAMERDLGITQSEFPEYIRAEELAADFEELAKTQLGDSYAGSWLNRLSEGQYEHVIATNDKADSLAIDGANVIQVNYSLDQLEAGMVVLNETIDKMNNTPVLLRDFTDGRIDGVHSWHIDVQTNSIVVSAAADSLDDAIKFIADSDIDINMVQIEESTGIPSTMINIYGGQSWSGCSVGFPVTRGSTKGFVTAGHCGGRGSSVTINGSRIGSLQQSSFPGNDMAWGNVRSSDSLQPFVSRYNGGSTNDIRVRGTRVASIGASICRSGRTTGFRCGNVISRNATVNYGTGPVRGLTQSTACAGRGDSGGSWITPAGQAQGVTSGGQLPSGRNDNCSVSTPVSWFQPVREILNTYGLRISR